MRSAISRIPRSIALIMVGALLAAAPAYAITKVIAKAPSAPDFEPVTVDESSVTLLTDQTGTRTVQITNATNVTLCISVDADGTNDCAGETLTCTGGDNFTVILAGGSKAWLLAPTAELCGKTASAPTGVVTVEEIVQ